MGAGVIGVNGQTATKIVEQTITELSSGTALSPGLALEEVPALVRP